MRWFLVPVLVALTSCGAITNWIKGEAKEAVAAEAQAQVEKRLEPEERAEYMKADTNADGKVSFDELQVFAGSGGLLAFFWFILRRRMSKKFGEMWQENKVTNAELTKLRELMVAKRVAPPKT